MQEAKKKQTHTHTQAQEKGVRERDTHSGGLEGRAENKKAATKFLYSSLLFASSIPHKHLTLLIPIHSFFWFRFAFLPSPPSL
jgi:hypothetical protein